MAEIITKTKSPEEIAMDELLSKIVENGNRIDAMDEDINDEIFAEVIGDDDELDSEVPETSKDNQE